MENTVSYNPAYPSNDYNYTIYDIDKDGTPEMFVKMGTCEADYAYYLYAYHENRDCAKFVAEIPAGHSVLCGLENEDAFVVQLGHQGYERITKYIYRNSLLTSETLYEKADDAFHEYANLDGLPYYAVTDPNGLLWTGNPHDGNQHILDNL